MKAFTVLLYTTLFVFCGVYTSRAENSYLVGNQGIIIPPPVLQSTPYVREVPDVVVPESKIVGDVEIKTSMEYNGVEQTKEAMEGAGFFSIVTAKDI